MSNPEDKPSRSYPPLNPLNIPKEALRHGHYGGTAGQENTANARQIGGEHYRKYGHLQPWDVIIHFKLDYLTGNAVKYLLRWRDKGGIEDIRKAMHYIEKLVESIDKQRKELEGSVEKGG